jgi:transposase
LREWMYERKREHESLTARELTDEIEEQFQVRLSIGHVNYLLRKVGLTGPRGHPCRRREETEATPAAEPQADESLDNAGTFFPRGSETGDGDHHRG